MAFKAPQYETLKFQSRLTRHAYFYSLDYVGRWTLYELILGRHYIPGGIAHTVEIFKYFASFIIMRRACKLRKLCLLLSEILKHMNYERRK